MSAPAHTQGPMKHERLMGTIQTGFRDVNIFHCGLGMRPSNMVDEQVQNARRLVACWNACEGLTTEQVEQGNAPHAPPGRRIASYADLRRAEKECTQDATVEVPLGFLLALRKGSDARDEFAKAAMRGLLARQFTKDERDRPFVEWMVELSYEIADAMIKARES